MLRLHRHLPFFIATCFALRALVPVGYMLQAPADTGVFGFGLLLCPTQNPGLKLEALDGPAAHGVHNHNAPPAPPADGAGIMFDAGGGCSDWLNSSIAIAMTLPPVLPAASTYYALHPLNALVELRRRGTPQARAPPV